MDKNKTVMELIVKGLIERGDVSDLVKMALIDPLTGMGNRNALFFDMFSDMLINAIEDEKASIAVIDLDHFKKLNDTHGHVVGDMALEHISNIMKGHFDPYTTMMCRYGGEEFIVLGLEDPHEFSKQTEGFLKNLRDTPLKKATTGESLNITASIGVISGHLLSGVFDKIIVWGAGNEQSNKSHELQRENHVPTLLSLIAEADNLMYQAKERGRNRICDNGDMKMVLPEQNDLAIKDSLPSNKEKDLDGLEF